VEIMMRDDPGLDAAVRGWIGKVGVCGVLDALAGVALAAADGEMIETPHQPSKPDWDRAADLLAACWEEMPAL
jgi:hypothetical protein